MLDRILGAFRRRNDQEVEDFWPLVRIADRDLACVLDPALAGRLWKPGEVVQCLYEILEVRPGPTGPDYRVRHLAYRTDLRILSPLLAYVAEPRARAGLLQVVERHAGMGVHPNLVAVLGSRTVDEVPRILTEIPRGEPLEKSLGPQGIEGQVRLLDLAQQACQGLDFIHQNGLVHLDPSAASCLVDRAGTLRWDGLFPARSWGDLRAEDLDSGLSKDRSIPAQVRDALPGPVPGRPAFLAPEQWTRGAAANRASNLYSLGVLLHLMATGRPPFRAFQRHGRSQLASLKARVLTDVPQDPRQFREDLPEDLAHLILECLRRDPSDRPDSAAAVGERLGEILRRVAGRPSPRPLFAPGAFQAENLVNQALMDVDRGRLDEALDRLDEALEARPDLPEAQVDRAILRWQSGQERLVEALGAWPKTLPSPGRVFPAPALRQEVSFAAQQTQLLALRGDEKSLAPAQSGFPARPLAELVEEVDALPAGRPLRAWLLVQGGEERRGGQILDQLERTERSGWVQNLRGILLLQEGSSGQALTAFERATELEPVRWEFHHNLGICLSRTGDKEKALPHLEKARALAGHPVALVSLAVALGGQGRVKEARRLLDEARERDPDSAWVQYHLGALHGSMGLRVPGFDANPTDLDLAGRHLKAAVTSEGGFYRARGALAECLRRQEREVVLPPLWDLPGSGRELRELGSLWTVRLSRVLSGHKEAVNTVTMSWDGRYIVSAGHDDSILVWDPLKGEVRSRLRGHAGPVRCVSVSADSSTLASGSDDGTVRLWQMPGGPTLHVLKGHQGPVAAAALSPAGSVLVTGGDDRTVRVWEARTGDLRHVLEEHGSRVTAVVVNYDASVAVSASADRTVLVWELVTGGVLVDLADLGESIYSLALSSDSRYLLTGGSGRVLRLWDLESGEVLRALVGHENEIRAVSLSPDGRFALSGGWDRSVRLWNVATGECIRTLSGHEHQVTAVHACADGRFGLSGSLDRSLRMWEWKEELLPLVPGRPPLVPASADRAYREEAGKLLATEALTQAQEALDGGRAGEALAMLRKVQSLPGRKRDPEVLDLVARCGGRRVGVRAGWCRRFLEGHENWVLRAEFSPDGRLAATGGLDGLVVLWDPWEGVALRTVEGHGREISGLAFTPDGERLLSSSYDRTLRLWDLESGQEEAVLRGHRSEATGCALSAELPLALSGSLDGAVIAWDLERCEPVREMRGHDSVVFGVALEPSGRQALTAGSDRRVLLWDLGTGQVQHELCGHGGPVVAVRFSPDGRRALSAGEDRRAILWDLETGREVLRLEGHEGALRCVDFAPDGLFAATAGEDGKVRLWALADGSCLAVLDGHEGPVRWVRFAPDGRHLLTAGNDRRVGVWELDWEVEV